MVATEAKERAIRPNLVVRYRAGEQVSDSLNLPPFESGIRQVYSVTHAEKAVLKRAAKYAGVTKLPDSRPENASGSQQGRSILTGVEGDHIGLDIFDFYLKNMVNLVSGAQSPHGLTERFFVRRINTIYWIGKGMQKMRRTSGK